MKTSKSIEMAAMIAAKKAAAEKANEKSKFHKGGLIITQFKHRRQTRFRNNLEVRSIYKNKVSNRSAYVSDAMAAKFGIQ